MRAVEESCLKDGNYECYSVKACTLLYRAVPIGFGSID